MTSPAGKKESLQPCPLCGSDKNSLFYSDKTRDYLRCFTCRLVFVPRRFHLSSEEEKAIYDLHQNSPLDQGYRRFLNRVYQPMSQRLVEPCRGLDFGSGPGPVLAGMFADDGHDMSIYDIYYSPNQQVLKNTYNFITLTEVVEHLSSPGYILTSLWSIIEPQGWFGFMTKLVVDRKAFATWHYKNDPTHICFFSVETFKWLGKEWGASLEFIGSDVVFIQKKVDL